MLQPGIPASGCGSGWLLITSSMRCFRGSDSLLCTPSIRSKRDADRLLFTSSVRNFRGSDWLLCCILLWLASAAVCARTSPVLYSSTPFVRRLIHKTPCSPDLYASPSGFTKRPVQGISGWRHIYCTIIPSKKSCFRVMIVRFSTPLDDWTTHQLVQSSSPIIPSLL